MEKKILLIALVLGMVSIILGAFGAHALKKSLPFEQLQSFEIGVRYMMYHALFLVFISATAYLSPEQKNIVFYLAFTGTMAFSVSIFLLATRPLLGFSFKFLGPITPLGGLLLIASWALTFYYILTKKA
jgi:uncharacterized membrane protein YgdD (TMEM256/DUF423 family)